VSNGLGLIIESLVAVLLLLTISFCVVLNTRLKKLKADEHALKGTIAELITATEIAERAIAGLKMTVREGEALARELGLKLESGREVLSHLAQIALAARPTAEPAAPKAPPAPDAQATAQAASAFAARARQRLSRAA